MSNYWSRVVCAGMRWLGIGCFLGMMPVLTTASEPIFEAKNLHAVLFELPASTARHFNAIADRAKGMVAGEHMPFAERDQRYIMLAIPAAPLPKQQFIKEYQRLEVLVDGEQRIRLADFPRLFSHSLDDHSQIRGVPTIVPLEEFPPNFIGEAHDFELLRDGIRIFGPVRWLVPDERTGPVVTSVNSGQEKGEITFEWEKIDFKLMAVVIYVDAAFQDPISIVQVLPDGSSSPLTLRAVGLDMMGDQPIFRESYVEGFHAGFARELTIRIRFRESGTGYFAAVGQLYTTFAANQVIDVP